MQRSLWLITEIGFAIFHIGHPFKEFEPFLICSHGVNVTLLMALFDYVCLFETRLVLRLMYHRAQHLSVGMRARTRTGTSLVPYPAS